MISRFSALLVLIMTTLATTAHAEDLFTSAARSDLATLERLLAAKPDLRATDASGRPALLYAAERGRLDVARRLLEAGADVNQQDTALNDFITVTDHGRGIPEDFRHHIFTKFTRALDDNAQRAAGTGLRLAICKALVEKHSGTIGFTSAVGEGSTFYFDLPEHRVPEAREPLESSRPRH